MKRFATSVLFHLTLTGMQRDRLGVLAAVTLVVSVSGCRGPSPSAPTVKPAADAPFDLAHDADLATLRDRFDGTPRGKRQALGEQLASQYKVRAARALEGRDPAAGFAAYTRLVSICDHPDELARPCIALAQSTPLAAAIRSVHASRGADHQTVLALYHLAAAEPQKRAERLGEIEAIFAYSDELAVAEHGAGAERSRPIEILEKVVAVAPFPIATKRLQNFYRDRHKAIRDVIAAGNLSYELIGAHGQGVLRSAWHIVRVHALARTLPRAPAALVTITGFGDNPDLRRALTAALTTRSPSDVIALADQFAGDDEDARDLSAALAILSWALETGPADPALLTAAGLLASKNNQIARAVRLLEAAIDSPSLSREAAAELAELYEFRVTSLSLTGRPSAARAVLKKFETHYARSSAKWPDFNPDLANAYAAMGRGLLSLGEIGPARSILSRSLGARTNFEALEHLGTLALRRDDYKSAADYFGRALGLPAGEPSVRFNRTKLMRLAGEALLGDERPDEAYGMFLSALDEWRKLRSSETFALRTPFAAEALVESGKLLWHVGKRDVALTAFAAAQDTAPTDANTYASIVSFLVVRDRYDDALDAYHRALGAAEVSEYFKVYMSLWILAESRRAGLAVDPFVRDYLASRKGELWQHQLARFASGQLELGPLAKRATTRARRAELLYYNAVLGAPSASIKERESLLRDVVATEMIMFFEYEMAKHWLRRGFAAPRTDAP